MLEVFIASVFIQIFGLVTPLFTQLILDRVVVQRSELTLTAVGIGLLIFNLFRVAMTGLRQYLLDHTANRIDLALNCRIYSPYPTATLEFLRVALRGGYYLSRPRKPQNSTLSFW